MINEWVRQEIIKLKVQFPPNNILRHARQKVKYNLCKIFPTSQHQYSLMQTEFSHLKMEHEVFKFPFIELFHGERFTVGAAISRPKSFDFADVFYKSYRITVPIILGRLIAAPTLVGTKQSDKLRFGEGESPG